MGKPLYKSVYVIAGATEDGTYGIMRNTPTNTVDYFNTPNEALEHVRKENAGSWTGLKCIAIDIGLLLDPKIKKKWDRYSGKTLDASVKYSEDE